MWKKNEARTYTPHGPDEPFGIWIRFLMAVNTVSMVIDVVRYMRGDRAETVKV